MRVTVLAALIGALFAAVVMGGLLAVDRTVLHVYTEDDVAPTPGPDFTENDAVHLTQEALTRRPFPSGTNAVRCTSATFRPGNRMWIVTCEFSVDRDFAPPSCETRIPRNCPADRVSERIYVFNDTTGETE